MKGPIPQKRRLSLRPGHQQAAEASLQSRKAIASIIKRTRNPFGEIRQFNNTDLEEMEGQLRKLEKELLQRELSVQEMETHLTNKERDLWEAEELLKVREQLVASRTRDGAGAVPAENMAVAKAEREALEKWQAQLLAQQESLKAAQAELREREAFVEESENRLLEKTMEQQEMEMQLEQKQEDIAYREQTLLEKLGEAPPAPPAEKLD